MALSLTVDERITRPFAAKLVEVEQAEAKLAELKARWERAQNIHNTTLNAATHGQGDWGTASNAWAVLKQTEKLYNEHQELTAKLQNQLNGMRKSFSAEVERAAVNACAAAQG